jgi:hypothetical protein
MFLDNLLSADIRCLDELSWDKKKFQRQTSYDQTSQERTVQIDRTSQGQKTTPRDEMYRHNTKCPKDKTSQGIKRPRWQNILGKKVLS